MGWACSYYGGEERCIQGFGGEIDHSDDLAIYGRIILECILKVGNGEAWTALTWRSGGLL